MTGVKELSNVFAATYVFAGLLFSFGPYLVSATTPVLNTVTDVVVMSIIYATLTTCIYYIQKEYIQKEE